MSCDFEKGSQNQHFQSTLQVGREWVTKKRTLCTIFIMLTNLDKPLSIIIELITEALTHSWLEHTVQSEGGPSPRGNTNSSDRYRPGWGTNQSTGRCASMATGWCQ